jgi:epoxyqueuosine reductase
MISPELLNELGVVDWGYTEENLPASFSRFDDWVKAGHHGALTYLSDHRKDLRDDLKKLYPDFQSALVFLFSYRPAKKWLLENNRHEIASYALGFGGEDYHHSLKRSLTSILEDLKKENSGIEGFLTLDAQPVLERDLAFRAGLGWFGKNSMLINRSEGSYFIIGSILLNQKLPITVKQTETDHCGQCRACVDACPTLAIDGDTRTLTADKCISTFTIELMKEAPAPAGMENSRGEVFGCDICQDICPWNTKPLVRTTPSLFLEKFPNVAALFSSSPASLLQFFEKESGRGVQKHLAGSALSRPGKKGWLKNLKFVISSRNGS